jgi:hypothetical protein
MVEHDVFIRRLGKDSCELALVRSFNAEPQPTGIFARRPGGSSLAYSIAKDGPIVLVYVACIVVPVLASTRIAIIVTA